MSLRYAILTALLEKPSTGLELTRRFDRSIGYFWTATHQQVYRELGRLEDDDLVVGTAVLGQRGSPRSYDVLPSGRSALRAWVGEPAGPRGLRDPLMLRMRAAGVVGTEGLVPELERQLVEHQQTLAAYVVIELRDFAGPDPDEATRLNHLVLRAGIGSEEHWIAWLESALAELVVPRE